MRFFTVLLLLFVVSGAAAQVHSCRVDGQIVFQSTPCGQSKQGSANACEKSLSEYAALISVGKAAAEDRVCYTQMQKQQQRDEAQRLRDEAAAEKKREKEEEARKKEERKALIAAREEQAERDREIQRQEKIKQAKQLGLYFVEYRAGGSTRSVNVTFRGPGGTEQHYAYVDRSWSMTVGKGHSLYFSAQNRSDYGSVTAEIWVNGVKVKTASSTAAYGIATVSGRL